MAENTQSVPGELKWGENVIVVFVMVYVFNEVFIWYSVCLYEVYRIYVERSYTHTVEALCIYLVW